MKTKTKKMTLFQVANRALGGAIAFTHEIVGFGKEDYLVTRGFLSIQEGKDDTKLEGRPVVVIDGEYDLGGRIEIPAETSVQVSEDGKVEFKWGGYTHRLTFYRNGPMRLS
jgi:hypothetical protein